MRFDTAGLFWDDTPPPRATKPPPPKREPPPRTWEAPDYLPYLDEARRFPVEMMTDEDLRQLHPLVMDCEVYPNYFLVAFTCVMTGRVHYFESIGADAAFDALTASRLLWFIQNRTIITFNGNYFDVPMVTLAIAGKTCLEIQNAANQIILFDVRPWHVLRAHKLSKIKGVDHIDLIEVAPLQASLKIYGGRLHVPRMQELPFKPATYLTEDQIAIVRWYCIGSDLPSTAFLYMELRPQIELRAAMGRMYGVDLRSKSDAQIAEAVIITELRRIGCDASRPAEDGLTSFKYRVPDYVRFQTPVMQAALETVRAATFHLGGGGSPELPEEIAALRLPIGGNFYQMGIGGLHSCESCIAHKADAEHFLADRDVTSYYPNIILRQGLFPAHLGTAFLDVYRELVDRRIRAKKEKNKTEADTLKIVVNGSFGKLGSPWSALYAPDLMVQVTMSGQLSLLMLVERLELAGIPVCSANTDGVLSRCPRARRADFEAVIALWEKDTGFTTEETQYSAIYARDVNNYIALKEGGGFKLKGIYSERGSANDSVLSKNPESLVCSDAVQSFLATGKPVGEYIRECRDIRRFITVRTCQGGAVKDGEYLGKAIRYYYAEGQAGEIIYAKNGHKVPRSDGARPCMNLPAEFPADVDFARYEREALEILAEIGHESFVLPTA